MKLKMGSLLEKERNVQNVGRAYSWLSMLTEEAAEDAATQNLRNKKGEVTSAILFLPVSSLSS